MNPYILTWLEAPLQSWGADSKFGRRDSLDFPTRSGILGLLCCALGQGGAQREWLAKMSRYSQLVVSYARKREPRDGKSVKIEREPLLRDFQMVGSGYDKKDPWQNLLIPKTTEGKNAVGGGTKLTYRYYLQDMAFSVIAQLPEDEADAIVSALCYPVWDIYLGRKNCVPTDVVYRGLYSREVEALNKAKSIASAKGRVRDFEVREGELDGEVFQLNDVPVQFGTEKQYRDRRVTVRYE